MHMISGYKVHSSDICNARLLKELARINKLILLSAGGTTIREIAYALNTLKTNNYSAFRPVLLHGFQSYPTALEDTKLLRLNLLKSSFESVCDFGYMDHADADSPFSLYLPLMAVSMGALTIEKHITLNRAEKGIDYYSSFNPAEFANFVRLLKTAVKAMGSAVEEFSSSEKKYRNEVKKNWVTLHSHPKGHILSEEDLVMKRCFQTLSGCIEIENLTNRPLLCQCDPDHELTRNDVPVSVWALIAVRLRSSRLPQKALLDVEGMPAIRHLIERLKQAKLVNHIVLCTTNEPEDDPLIKIAEDASVGWARGPTEDVLGRMMEAIQGKDVDIIIRVTGDDILVDPDYVDKAIRYHLVNNAEYSDLKSLPSGTEVEVFDTSLLQQIWRLSINPGGTEYLTTYITSQKDQIRTVSVPVEGDHAKKWRLTLDTTEDYSVICHLLKEMKNRGKYLTYRLDDIVDYFSKNPEILLINTSIRQRITPPEVNTSLDWKRLI